MALLVGLNYKHNPNIELKSSYNNVLLFELLMAFYFDQ